MLSLNKTSQQGLAKLSAIYSGLVFGIYWIPIRALDATGFSGVWAAFVFNLIATAIVTPIIVIRWRSFIYGSLRFHLICFGTGLGFTLYASSFVYTNVVSVIVMFYMMPIWGFLLARWIIGDAITPIRWVSMIIGIAGLVVILGLDSGLPLPRNAGDWMALVAGILWAALSLSILTDKKQEKPVNYASGFIIWSCIATYAMGSLATHLGIEPLPQWQRLYGELIWLLPFSLFVIVPAAIATIYGPSKLNPGVVGLFFMTEISVATITAALWAGEPFGAPQILGVTLITVAGVLETVFLLFRNQPRPQS